MDNPDLNDILSFPEDLTSQIRQIAAQVRDERPLATAVVQSPRQSPPPNPKQQVLAELARQYPELLAFLVVADTSFTGIEVTEEIEVSEDKVVTLYDRGSDIKQLKPIVTKSKKRRVIQFHQNCE